MSIILEQHSKIISFFRYMEKRHSFFLFSISLSIHNDSNNEVEGSVISDDTTKNRVLVTKQASHFRIQIVCHYCTLVCRIYTLTFHLRGAGCTRDN